jgi:hypothetical protein
MAALRDGISALALARARRIAIGCTLRAAVALLAAVVAVFNFWRSTRIGI